MDLRDFIRDIPDFPKPGVQFKDITPLLADPTAFQHSIDLLSIQFAGQKIDAIAAAEARGFIFGAPLALELGISFVPIRKPGKLPFETRRFEYDLEYGSDSLEMHVDALPTGSRVLLIDDLLATGGTIEACKKLAEHSDAEVVGCGFLVELTFLNGRDRLKNCDVYSLIQYDGED